MRGVTIACPKCATEMPVAFSFCGKCGARLLALAPSEGETKQVTVLFADISGFTALAERLDPEELHEKGLSIALAKVNTEGQRVADVFYVRTPAGGKLDRAGQLAELSIALREAIRKLD